MAKVLITGATGNVGLEVIRSLQDLNHQLDLHAGVRNIEEDKSKLANRKINLIQFDFTDSTTWRSAIEGCDIVFLLRPPQISDVKTYFIPIIEQCKEKGVKHIVFLSVQGVDNSKIIPHHKIEKLIVESKINYTFLRPAYFMQNFTTTLRNDLVNYKRIYLPAGQAKFTLIDVRDVGAVAARVLTDISQHVNKSYELTSKEKLTFKEMAIRLSDHLGVEIQFKSPNLLAFYLTKRREKVPGMFILVMIMLHFLPRFQKEPATTDWIKNITNKQPITFDQFILDHKKLLTS